ncbi:MAG: SGNH/GDSL hydrolase family protein [Candidatus Hydrogenedentes bacterium]|nr:SGNH/GDSL hydrolase family protein [Candidatus Hydrogenedentota bacterium]
MLALIAMLWSAVSPCTIAREPDTGEEAALRKVYVIGDSISIQYGPYLQQYLRGFMDYDRKGDESEKNAGLEEPRGANGGDSSMVLRFVEAAEKAGGLGADVLLLNCGLHDIKTAPQTGAKQVPIDQYEENLKKIVASARRMNMKVVWVRTTPVDENVHNKPDSIFHRFAADCAAYNDVADQVMKEAGVPEIDLFAFTNNIGENLFADHVHFPEPVREKQGAFIAGWLVAWNGKSTN